MKKIAAILIAFFLCVGVTQVSAQKVLTLKTVSTDNYTIEPTDETVMLTGKNRDGILYLPDPAAAANKGRVIQILNRKENAITIHLFRTGVLHKPIPMLILSSVAFISDGEKWYIFSKSW